MRVLVTGSAGFIGFSVAKRLLSKGYSVLGVDNHNEYYDPELKRKRVEILSAYGSYIHRNIDICDQEHLNHESVAFQTSHVIHLAAQAGVRHSIEYPEAFIQSNLVGFSNMLELCRNQNVRHFIFASSSSVYGGNQRLPFCEEDRTDEPLSLYAATKKSNEVMAYSYSHLFGLTCTGLRFFTVYGPWGRPDMAIFKFVKAIKQGSSIELFNSGNHSRDFTYIEDVVDRVMALLDKPPLRLVEAATLDSSGAAFRVLNVGGGNKVALSKVINLIESRLGKKAELKLMPIQMGDVPETSASRKNLDCLIPGKFTSIEHGLEKFINWYEEYYEQFPERP